MNRTRWLQDRRMQPLRRCWQISAVFRLTFALSAAYLCVLRSAKADHDRSSTRLDALDMSQIRNGGYRIFHSSRSQCDGKKEGESRCRT
jgi:hypothetical protein